MKTADLIIHWQSPSAFKGSQRIIQRHLDDVLRRLGSVGRVEIEISLVTDKEIRILKTRFLGIDESTDVLSFPSEGKLGQLTGSIAISIQTARRQAEQAGVDIIDEVKMLAGHGLLHLLGYQHRWI